jgi:hypothetical protein
MSVCERDRLAGLDNVIPLLTKLWDTEVAVGEVRTVLGPVYLAGGPRPLPSSAAELRAGGHTVWVPAPVSPSEPDRGLAPLYLYAGQKLVMPTIRLCVTGPADDALTVEYLSLADWLHDALSRWRFAPLRSADREGAATVLEALSTMRPDLKDGLRAVAHVIRYALFGSDHRLLAAGLRLPPCPMWLRPAEGTELARRAARSLVVSARLAAPAGDAAPALPGTDLRAARYRVRPADPRDWGVDPVHTPEGADIRLTGRLGVGVAVWGRKLDAPLDRVSLSPSTARLPLAGYDDPRRLLMAANMQTHAVPLVAAEPPLVRAGADGAEPPGVNLCVGYLAWQGWNHEDAWALSESAARRLTAVEESVQTVAVRAVEMPADLRVKVGQTVRRGDLLVRRSLAPALLCGSMEILASLPGLDHAAPLRPEPEDRAKADGEVVRIEEWDLLRGTGVPAGLVIPEALTGSYRTVYRVHLRRTLPLAVGDKLANRHGHKGVVGAILPDHEMPRWRGRPLDALLDPISVLNRSNWGQVYEALAGALAQVGGSPVDAAALSGEEVLRRAGELGADARGRWDIDVPQHPAWMSRPTRAVAGVQLVMRMPHHACDKITGSLLPPADLAPTMRRRAQRFGEMDHWALWAHGLVEPAAADRRPSGAAARLSRLLACAGFSAEREGVRLTVRRLPLDGEPPAGADRLPLGEGSLTETYDALDRVGPEGLTVLVFDPPVAGVPLPEKEPADESGAGQPDGGLRRRALVVRWLPVLPACDRPERHLPDDSTEPHELTQALRRVVRAACGRQGGADGDEPAGGQEAALRYAVRGLMEDAYALAVGLRATGLLSSKMSLLRRGVLGRRLGHSGRATASPGGTLFLGLDEVGLPPALARALLGPGLPVGEAELAEAVRGRGIWLKRDPVLHRWGLLPVRVRAVPGDTVRLPASLLGPLGADFDGDTVALFAALPDVTGDVSACRPPALAWHRLLDRPMFFPGKQYVYGLHLLTRDPDRLSAFREALRQAGAPDWPAGDDIGAASRKWVRATADTAADGRWWAVIEEHALGALARKPDMDFGLLDFAALSGLEVVRCGAAKNLYDADARPALEQILTGRSLDIYRRRDAGGDAGPPDPIADVMVAAKAAIGRFGGALRRLVYTAQSLGPAQVQQAQCLTEQVTQKALSVKAGKPPVQYGEYESQLRRLLKGQAWELPAASELRGILEPMRGVWDSLRAVMPADPAESAGWLEWLRKPYELADLLQRAPQGALTLPLDDLRLSRWTESDDLDNAPAGAGG